MRFQFNQNKARYETKELNQAQAPYQANPEKLPLKLLCAPFHGAILKSQA